MISMIAKNGMMRQHNNMMRQHRKPRHFTMRAAGNDNIPAGLLLVISLSMLTGFWFPAVLAQQTGAQPAEPRYAETQQTAPQQKNAPQQTGPERQAPQQSGSQQTGPQQIGPQQIGPQQIGPQQIGPQQTGAQQARIQQIVPAPIEAADIGGESFSIGSLSVAEGALPPDLWRGASRGDLEFLFRMLPRRYLRPAYLDILRRTLLAAGAGPDGADDALTGQKLMILAQAGFFDEASSLAALASGLQVKPDLAQAIAYREMMRGDMPAACARGAGLRAGRGQAFWLKLRVLCFSLNDEKAAADVTIGLLQDQNALTANELKLFRALAQNKTKKTSIIPLTGFEYAVLRALRQPLTLSAPGQADGAVLRALALDEGIPSETRIMAAARAAYLGIMTVTDLAALFGSFEFETAQLIEVKSRLKTRDADRLIDPLAYQAVRELGASENRVEVAAMIGRALLQAEDVDRFTALARLYVPIIRQMEVIVNYIPYAEIFALAGIVAEDAGVADRWIGALALDQSNPDGSGTASALVSMLALRAPDFATTLAQQYGLEVTIAANARRVELGLPVGGEEEAFAQLLDLGFDASIHAKKGQSALVALSIAGLQGASDSVLAKAREVAIYQTLATAGLEGILGDLAFDRVLRAYLPRLAKTAPISPSVADEITESVSPTISAASARVTPRVKPAPKE